MPRQTCPIGCLRRENLVLKLTRPVAGRIWRRTVASDVLFHDYQMPLALVRAVREMRGKILPPKAVTQVTVSSPGGTVRAGDKSVAMPAPTSAGQTKASGPWVHPSQLPQPEPGGAHAAAREFPKGILNSGNQDSETLETLRSCRDHWKTSFEHERENVIRLRRLVWISHGPACACRDCDLHNQHNPHPV